MKTLRVAAVQLAQGVWITAGLSYELGVALHAPISP